MSLRVFGPTQLGDLKQIHDIGETCWIDFLPHCALRVLQEDERSYMRCIKEGSIVVGFINMYPVIPYFQKRIMDGMQTVMDFRPPHLGERGEIGGTLLFHSIAVSSNYLKEAPIFFELLKGVRDEFSFLEQRAFGNVLFSSIAPAGDEFCDSLNAKLVRVDPEQSTKVWEMEFADFYAEISKFSKM